MKKIKNLCGLGIHLPLKNHRTDFVDSVSGKMVYTANCPCGKQWMVDHQSKFSFFKVEK